jgi:hypothetical protein
METEPCKLDDEWINTFEKTDKLYQEFYKDDLYYTNLQIVYVNRGNEIEKIKQEAFLMTKPNFISREEIIGILKNNSIDNGRRYTLLTILKYNVTLDADDIKGFLKDDISYNFLTIVKNIDAIKFDKTINMLHDLNDLVLIFYEKSNEFKNVNLNTMTKRIYLDKVNSKKRTIKKQYKD